MHLFSFLSKGNSSSTADHEPDDRDKLRACIRSSRVANHLESMAKGIYVDENIRFLRVVKDYETLFGGTSLDFFKENKKKYGDTYSNLIPVGVVSAGMRAIGMWICDEFIREGAPSQVNIDGPTRTALTALGNEGSIIPADYKPAVRTIENLLVNDAGPRLLIQEQYKASFGKK